MTFLEHYWKRVLMGSYTNCDIAIDTAYVRAYFQSWNTIRTSNGAGESLIDLNRLPTRHIPDYEKKS